VVTRLARCRRFARQAVLFFAFPDSWSASALLVASVVTHRPFNEFLASSTQPGAGRASGPHACSLSLSRRVHVAFAELERVHFCACVRRPAAVRANREKYAIHQSAAECHARPFTDFCACVRRPAAVRANREKYAIHQSAAEGHARPFTRSRPASEQLLDVRARGRTDAERRSLRFGSHTHVRIERHREAVAHIRRGEASALEIFFLLELHAALCIEHILRTG
jgi:hypothetical protein